MGLIEFAWLVMGGFWGIPTGNWTCEVNWAFQVGCRCNLIEVSHSNRASGRWIPLDPILGSWEDLASLLDSVPSGVCVDKSSDHASRWLVLRVGLELVRACRVDL